MSERHQHVGRSAWRSRTTVGIMAAREVDEELAMLCHIELAGGQESLAETVADLPRSDLERLLCLAIGELMESRQDADKQVARMARRLQQRRSE
jgi:hypothetical protein